MAFTDRMEIASHKYVECGNKSEAYRHAYSTDGWKTESVNQKASTLFARVDVKSRVKELQEELKKKNEVTKEDIINKLFLIVNDYEDNKEFTNSADQSDIRKAEVLSSLANSSSSISALKQISKMLGYDAPDKIELTVKAEQPLFKKVD